MAKLPTWLHLSDLQGLAQLATQGTLGVAGLAETVQGNVYKAVAATLGPLGAKFIDTRPGSSGVKRAGITGLVYGSIKGVTRLAVAPSTPYWPPQRRWPARKKPLHPSAKPCCPRSTARWGTTCWRPAIRWPSA